MMNETQAISAMISAAEGYSWLILKSINTAIAIDMDMDTCKKIINEWIQIRNTIITELIESGYCIA